MTASLREGRLVIEFLAITFAYPPITHGLTPCLVTGGALLLGLAAGVILLLVLVG
jgi:hypothetical protein